MNKSTHFGGQPKLSDYTDNQPFTDGFAKTHQTLVEFLGAGYDGSDCAHVLLRLLQFLRTARKRLAKTVRKIKRTTTRSVII